ncbi:MAG TPA: hypothetical protein VHO70_01380 [Chitinispirillaceae bacterium]|nr:hypothetical protein [Chitinispirillaceae bacterium]
MNQLAETRSTANELLSMLESSESTIEASLMKAKRLARLIRDTEAQLWRAGQENK